MIRGDTKTSKVQIQLKVAKTVQQDLRPFVGDAEASLSYCSICPTGYSQRNETMCKICDPGNTKTSKVQIQLKVAKTVRRICDLSSGDDETTPQVTAQLVRRGTRNGMKIKRIAPNVMEI